MSTTIKNNGSRFRGQEPGTLEELLVVLQVQPLDPRFEPYANFREEAQGQTVFWGNFFAVCHPFDIQTDDPDVIEQLLSAIRANQERANYQAAATTYLQEWIAERDSYAKAVHTAMRDDIRADMVERRDAYTSAIERATRQ